VPTEKTLVKNASSACNMYDPLAYLEHTDFMVSVEISSSTIITKQTPSTDTGGKGDRATSTQVAAYGAHVAWYASAHKQTTFSECVSGRVARWSSVP